MGSVMMSGVAPQMKKPIGVIALSELAVGSIVKMNVSNVLTEFIVVNQGVPKKSSLYDGSCNGVWLLMKDCYESRRWHSSNSNDYAASEIHSYLNGTLLNLFDTNIKSIIKQVKIPYVNGTGSSGSVVSGANGLSTYAFLLSAEEVSFNFTGMPTNEGQEIEYFAGCVDFGSDIKRVGYLSGNPIGWWLRSPYVSETASSILVETDGNRNGYGCTTSRGIRPALILPSNTLANNGSGIVVD